MSREMGGGGGRSGSLSGVPHHQPQRIDLEMGGGGGDHGITRSTTEEAESKLLSGELPRYIRHRFILKVYAILVIQLVVTFGIALMFGLWEAAGNFLIEQSYISIIAIVLAIVFLIVLACVPGVAQKYPANLILLFCFTLCIAVLMGYLAVRVSTEVFLSALGITLAVVFVLTVFAMQVKIDFTGFAPYMTVVLVVLLVFGIFAAIFRSHVLRMVYGALGALVFSLFIVFDTQMIMGGSHKKYQFTIDDYVLAAVALYTDIINLFTFIVMMMDG